ncbi:MAG: hypothetical protein QNK15_11780, partial [Cycloclasticus sp.]|nr:hypothetical protein [Cycloclasticus sp.]
VWIISALDLFFWQLPFSDNLNINDYPKLEKIMTIFFFFEKLYKNSSRLDSEEIDPFSVLSDLEKIVSYYDFSKIQEEA